MKKLFDIFSGNNKREHFIVLIASVIYLALASYFLYEDSYYILLAPLVVLGIYLFVFKLDYLLLIITLLTPFTVDFEIFAKNRLELPTEPLIILFALCFIIKVLHDRNYDSNIIKHPVSICISLLIAWMLISSVFSSLPLVSFKYTASRIWFVIPFFYAIILVFKKGVKQIMQFFWLYGVSLFIVICIVSIKFALKGFAFEYAHHIMCPLYNDHTVYGAVIAMFIPLLAIACFYHKTFNYKLSILIPFLAVFLTGLILSYSRAAWLSIGAATGMYFILLLRIKMKWILLGACLAGIGYIYHQNDILQNLEKNRQDSSGNISEQIESISNISTDASNVERLNRWACAFRMIKEHPILGFGPGTYQFNYASYQKSYQLSTVSTNRGDLGNAHSEYFTPLVDSGILGCLFTLLIFILTFKTGIRVYRQAEDKKIRLIALSFALALFTYYIHGLVNNFLDMDEGAVPFWGFTAIIVALDIYFPKQQQSLPRLAETNKLTM